MKRLGSKPSASFLSLEKAMNDSDAQVLKNDEFVCIKDKYPKAIYHFLLIPLLKVNGKRLSSVQELLKRDDSLEMLKKMRDLAIRVVNENCGQKRLGAEMSVGFHSIQSMQPLHMQIISTDFRSACLKNKKHFNSFTSKYFLHLDDLIEAHGGENSGGQRVINKFDLDNTTKLKEYLNQDLKCHKCAAKQSNMPTLKKHLESH